MNKIHKETFNQSAFEGIPSHWVVQYYQEGSGYVQAEYFSTYDEALEFEIELTQTNSEVG